MEQNLTDKQVKDIVVQGELAKTKEKILKFAMTRPRSQKEINDWLRRKKVHVSLYGKLKKLLIKYDLLDDVRFSGWWVEQRLRFNKRSIKEIINELRFKGIDKFTIEDTFAKFDVDEVKIAKKLIANNMYKWQKYEGFARKKKMTEYLARKGFDWEMIKSVVSIDDGE